MSRLVTVPMHQWDGSDSPVPAADLARPLESGGILIFPQLPLQLSAAEAALLDGRHADAKRKNITLGPDGKTVRGFVGSTEDAAAIRQLLVRFQSLSERLVGWLRETCRGQLQSASASLRLVRAENRASSWRKDDSRLHVDAFPSRPLAGVRILRVFANVSPTGEARVWRVGEDFEKVASRFLPAIRPPLPGSARFLRAVHATKSLRTPYDHYMLKLHDAMKADTHYQRTCEQETVPFPPVGVWVCYSDQVSHAVTSGQFMMEQTFFHSPAAMVFPELSPKSILERLTGRSLVA